MKLAMALLVFPLVLITLPRPATTPLSTREVVTVPEPSENLFTVDYVGRDFWDFMQAPCYARIAVVTKLSGPTEATFELCDNEDENSCESTASITYGPGHTIDIRGFRYLKLRASSGSAWRVEFWR